VRRAGAQVCLKAQVRFVSDKDAGVTLKLCLSGGVSIPVHPAAPRPLHRTRAAPPRG